jgi:lysophospholipase
MNLDSFDSPKFRPLGRFLVNVEIDWDLISRIKHQDQEEELIVAKNMCKEVSSIRLTPLTTEDTFREVFDNQHIRGTLQLLYYIRHHY